MKPNLFKQGLSIADATGTTCLTLWQDNIGTLETGKSYKMEGLFPRIFNNVNYLTPPKSGSLFTPVADIGHVEEVPEDKPNEIQYGGINYITNIKPAQCAKLLLTLATITSVSVVNVL